MPDDTQPAAFLDRLVDVFPDDFVAHEIRGHLACSLMWEGSAREGEAPDGIDPEFGFSPEWWADTGEVVATNPRPCTHCDVVMGRDAPDACLGMLPNVRFACCGHGHVDSAYVVLRSSAKRLGGEDALEWFAKKGVGPKSALVLELERYRDKFGPLS